MRPLSFKTPLYKWYAPKLFKLLWLKAYAHTTKYQLGHAQINPVRLFLWDHFLAQQFYKEAGQFIGQPFTHQKVKKKSDTVFILGCGGSINDLTNADWDIVSQHDSIGVNYFYAHPFKPTHHVVELGLSPLSEKSLKTHLLYNPSRNYENVFIHIRHLLNNQQIQFERDRENTYLYSPTVLKGCDEKYITSILEQYYFSTLLHHASNLDCALNLACLLGYKRIYFLGVDLNRRDYFWDTFQQNTTQSIVDVAKATQDDNNLHKFYENNRGTLHATVDPKVVKRFETLPITKYIQLVNQQCLIPKHIHLATCSPSSMLRDFLPYQDLRRMI